MTTPLFWVSISKANQEIHFPELLKYYPATKYKANSTCTDSLVIRMSHYVFHLMGLYFEIPIHFGDIISFKYSILITRTIQACIQRNPTSQVIYSNMSVDYAYKYGGIQN